MVPSLSADSLSATNSSKVLDLGMVLVAYVTMSKYSDHFDNASPDSVTFA